MSNLNYLRKDSRKQIKSQAKLFLKKDYFKAIVVSFIVVMLLGGVSSLLFSLLKQDQNNINNYVYFKNILNNFNVQFKYEGNIFQFINALVEYVFNTLTNGLSLYFYLVNAYLINNGGFLELLLILIALILILGYFIFIKYPLIIGAKRYFLERRMSSGDPDYQDLLYAYKTKEKNVFKVLILKNIYQALWNLTIIGGFIKFYEYRYIEYLLAENPNLEVKEYFKLAKEMSKGHKFKLFILDLSFIGYELLNLLTLDLLKLLFLNPYKEMVVCNTYVELRSNYINKTNSSLFSELMLETPLEVNSNVGRKRIDYDVHYSILDYVALFFIISIIGYLWEVGYHFVRHYELVNRGTLYGPYLPIYGFGSVLCLFTFQKIRKHHVLTFLSSMTLCTLIEYITHYVIEKATGLRYWNYSNEPFNINGRVYLLGALFFGIGASFIIYIVGPLIKKKLDSINIKYKKIILYSLTFIFLVDCIITLFNPRSGKGITSYNTFNDYLNYLIVVKHL